MKMLHKIGISILFIMIATAWLYAAGQQITSLTQSVWDGDIMTAQYYNKLNGPKSEGKVCKFVTDKLVCLDNMPINSSSSSTSGWWWWWWWWVTTPMNKTQYGGPNLWDSLTQVQIQENVDAWNAMRDATIDVWKVIHWENSAFMQDILKPGGWKDACTMSNTTFTIPNPNITFFNECSWNICGMKHGASLQSTVQCWTWSPTCFKWTWQLVCMY